MRTINSKEDLVQWANEVNRGLTTKQKPDYQDYYAHSIQKDLDKWFLEANGERKLILCSVYNTMAYEEVERLLLVWAKEKAQRIIDRDMEETNKYYEEQCAKLATREKALSAKEQAFQECKKPIHKHIAGLRERNTFLEQSFSRMRANEVTLVEDKRAYQRQAKEYSEKAARLDSIREQLGL
jgi:hypothetical protein